MTAFYQQVTRFLDGEAYIYPATATKDACVYCRGSKTNASFPTCFTCDQRNMKASRPDRLGFGIYAVNMKQSGRVMRDYKKSATATMPGSFDMAKQIVTCLAYLGIIRALERDQFDAVTYVPSLSSRTGPHPLQIVLKRALEKIQDAPPLTDALQPSDLNGMEEQWKRSIRPENFNCCHQLTGQRILLIDDTWASGGHMLSAVGALRQGGVQHVTATALARWLKDGFGTTPTILETMRRQKPSFSNYQFF